MAISRRPKNIRTLWSGAALHMVFACPSHPAYARVKALLGDCENCRSLSLLLKVCLGGFA